MNEQLIDKLENKCQMIESMEKDLTESRKRLSQRKSSIENGTRRSSLTRSEDELGPKLSQVKDAVMKEPGMEPKQPSEPGIFNLIFFNKNTEKV